MPGPAGSRHNADNSKGRHAARGLRCLARRHRSFMPSHAHTPTQITLRFVSCLTSWSPSDPFPRHFLVPSSMPPTPLHPDLMLAINSCTAGSAYPTGERQEQELTTFSERIQSGLAQRGALGARNGQCRHRAIPRHARAVVVARHPDAVVAIARYPDRGTEEGRPPPRLTPTIGWADDALRRATRGGRV